MDDRPLWPFVVHISSALTAIQPGHDANGDEERPQAHVPDPTENKSTRERSQERHDAVRAHAHAYMNHGHRIIQNMRSHMYVCMYVCVYA